ncbi:MAG: bifunctional methylenetetrahydrofolate dehydrogenase/methenyltetrahydrofolate cyclohydrolase FolD [Bacteroidota bacterium]|jgi:methylenetetrahydrofolate dehydrogenase (NADP+)/methenyltetrahydrofolate cyclohydrolase
MNLLDGKFLSAQIKEEIKLQIDGLIAEGKRVPNLVAVIVGDNPASQTYVASKAKNCDAVGMQSSVKVLPENISETELLKIISDLNNDETVDGFIVQLPLPKHISEKNIIEAIAPEKDVDGFHPVNLGKLMLGEDTFIPATPMGIMEMLRRYNIETKGKHAVVIGRSNIVGTPISLLLSRNTNPGNCTVTLCHSATKNLKEICQSADIIVAAIGKKNFVTADMVKDGAVIIDVGINRIAGEKKIYGDVDFENVAPKCSYITPVPGGVGLMTIAALMLNTIKSYQNKNV